MANGPEVLAAEYEKFVAFIRQYADISIAETKGEPPSTYVLSFDLRGYVPNEDGIGVSKPHSIRIRLLPGFPARGPEVMALTPIYHPAVDEDDGYIDVSVHWETQPTLPELVEHLAAMITGAVYNVPKPANPDAVSWYDEHAMELPLDALSHAVQDEDEEEEETAGAETAESDHPFASFEMAFDPAAGIDDTADLPDPQQYEAQIQEIRDLIEQEQVFQLDKKLAALPPNLWFPERSEADALVAAAKQQVRRLFEQAKELEGKGEYGKAMKFAQAILSRIPDHPEAQALAQRLQKSSFLADSLDDALNDAESAFADTTATAAPEADAVPGLGGIPGLGRRRVVPAPAEEEAPKGKKGLNVNFGSFFEDFPLRPVLLVVLGVVAFLWVLLHFLEDNATLDRARRGIEQAQTQIQAEQYALAKDTLERTRDGLKGLTVLFFRKGGLNKQINAMLGSSKLQEGARGQVQYKGRYVSEAAARALEEVEKIEEEARALVQEKQYDAAQRAYARAQQRVANIKDLTQEHERLEALAKGMAVEKVLDKAERAEQLGQWDEAVAQFQQAERQIRGDAVLSREYGRKIQRRRDGIEFRQTVAKATTAMGQNRLETARGAFQQAERMAAARGKSLPPEDRQLLEAARLQLDMSTILPDAKRAFETRKWQEAAALYQRTLEMAASSPPEVRRVMADFLGQLERARDLAEVNSALDEAKTAVSRKEWGTAVRMETEALNRISRSGLATDKDMANLKKQLEEQLAEHRREQSKIDLGRQLEARGMQLILNNFPNYKAENLGPPTAKFLRREGSRLIYELSSMDKSHGRPTKLSMQFAWDGRQWIRMK